MLNKYFFNQTKRLQQLTTLVVALIVACIGTYLLTNSHAAEPYVSTTADSGTLASGATKQTCSGSSDGSCVVFNDLSSITYGTTLNPFSSTAPFNVPIPANLPSSDYTLSSSNGPVTSAGGDFTAYAWPLYTATSSTPIASVTCNEYCNSPFSSGVPVQVPMPSGVVPSTGSDEAAGIVYEGPTTGSFTNGQTFEFWQLSGSGSSWSANGAGSGNISTTNSSIYGGATAPGFSLFTAVTVAQLDSGVINHALNFATEYTCTDSIPPAMGSDGHTSSSASTGCIPEGARVQLNPSVNLSGMTPFEQIIGKALQEYGAYCGDTSGNGTDMGIRFEGTEDIGNPNSVSAGQPDYYTAQSGSNPVLEDGNSSDFKDLNALPASDWRILNSWNVGD